MVARPFSLATGNAVLFVGHSIQYSGRLSLTIAAETLGEGVCVVQTFARRGFRRAPSPLVVARGVDMLTGRGTRVINLAITDVIFEMPCGERYHDCTEREFFLPDPAKRLLNLHASNRYYTITRTQRWTASRDLKSYAILTFGTPSPHTFTRLHIGTPCTHRC